MEDTESSDFLSSSDSFWSSASTATTSTNLEDPSYVGFDVFLTDGLTEAAKGEKDFEDVRMIPNSQLTSASHPVLIHLENEYQARRSFWNQHTGQNCRYSGEVEGWTSYPNKSKLASRGSQRVSRKQEKQLKDFVFPDGSNYEAHQGLKRQRLQDAQSLANWWKKRKETNLPVSDGDRIFAEKCQELQGFIRPLTELLNGLKRGRYDRGLSSFQQSVAMDRIQRIVGVLQKPEMGERYLSTLLQVEMMLKIWFPGVNSSSSSSSSSSSDFDMEEPQNKMAKHPDIGSTGQRSCHASPDLCPSSPITTKPSECCASAPVHTDCVCCKEVLAEGPTMNLTWMHTAPICNPPLSQADPHHLNAAGPDPFCPNGNICGTVFLVQSGRAAASPASQSVDGEEKPLDLRFHREGTEGQLSRWSKSDPAIFTQCSQTESRQPRKRSHSLTHLPTRSVTSGGENT
ncbi:circadian-associated transcriptional repressor isoform 3-T3 [Mantella aurantiaca]